MKSPEFGVKRTSHNQKTRQNVDENATDPRRHGVRLRRTKVHVQHDDSHTNTIDKDRLEMPVKSDHLCVIDFLYLNVSRIMVKRTNLPKRGTTKLVGGIISASKRKKTVNDSRIDMAKLTWPQHQKSRSYSIRLIKKSKVKTFSPESDGK